MVETKQRNFLIDLRENPKKLFHSLTTTTRKMNLYGNQIKR